MVSRDLGPRHKGQKGAFSVIVKLRVIFGYDRLKLYCVCCRLPPGLSLHFLARGSCAVAGPAAAKQCPTFGPGSDPPLEDTTRLLTYHVS